MKKNLSKKLKIFVAMSGGVDSSVSAVLLKRGGFDVYGVFIKGWYPVGISCDWRNDRRDAMRCAAKIGIPFYTFDFEKEYKKWVIDYMIREYKAGRTPNPDIMCNKHVKFDAFLKKALKMGADVIATGHYVKNSKLKTQNSKLFISKDKNKDQSYFLWALTQKQLKYCLFPVGGYEKTEVRKMAEKFGLPVAKKPDSQGLCFVGEFKMEDFLKRYIKPKSGKIVNENGKILGKHKGAHYYTIGQRQGLNLSVGVPYYVVAKDVRKNILVVTSGKIEKDFYKKEVEAADVNWISGKKPNTKKIYLGRIRYRQPLQKCRIKNVSGSKIQVSFVQAQRAVAPGQSFVLYDKDEMLGGGIIV